MRRVRVDTHLTVLRMCSLCRFPTTGTFPSRRDPWAHLRPFPPRSPPDQSQIADPVCPDINDLSTPLMACVYLSLLLLPLSFQGYGLAFAHLTKIPRRESRLSRGENRKVVKGGRLLLLLFLLLLGEFHGGVLRDCMHGKSGPRVGHTARYLPFMSSTFLESSSTSVSCRAKTAASVGMGASRSYSHDVRALVQSGFRLPGECAQRTIRLFSNGVARNVTLFRRR